MKFPWAKILFALLALAAGATSLRAADSDIAANAINAFGIDLLKKAGAPVGNSLLSPYSLQEALAMTYSGAAGTTRDEMAATLHFPKDDTILNNSFVALQQELAGIQDATVQAAKTDRERPWLAMGKEPIVLTTANRLYGQTGFKFRQPFLDNLKDVYHAPLEQIDFSDPEKAREQINAWVEDQTLKRIQNLIPEKQLTAGTVFVLVDAIYLKAQWGLGFEESLTKPGAFHVDGGEMKLVPIMHGLEMRLGYAKRDGYTALTIPYVGSQLQFVLLVPEKVNGLAQLESKITPGLLAGCAKLDEIQVDLGIPKFKLEPPVMLLGKQLQELGMKTAFSDNADFSRMASGYLRLGQVFHKTFLSLDEHGTEAAAASAVSGLKTDGGAPGQIYVDHPFLFAIQDRKSGACLFIGRVTDPRPAAEPGSPQ